MTAKRNANVKHLLQTYSTAPGAPGFEDAVAGMIAADLKGMGRMQYDNLGSILVEKTGKDSVPRIMIAAHMDEVAFMVKAVHSSGLLRFVPLGGWWPHVLPSQRVTIFGKLGPVPGIVGAVAPHHLSPAEKEKLLPIKSMFIDIGAVSAAQVEKLGIEVGQPILPHVEWREMADPRIVSGKAFDNRVGVAMMVQVMKNLQKHPNTVIATGTAQEEVGIRGAKTAVNLAKPDLAIILEGPPADDYPGCAEFPQCCLGKGPQIRAYDPTIVTNPRLVELFKSRANALGLPFQMAVRDSGGTDAAVIHVSHAGIPSIVIGVPVRHAHSHLGILSLDDVEASVTLVTDVINHLDRSFLKRLSGK
jgi:endoglucanase